MEISGDYKFNAPIEAVWKILMSREALKASLPGCETFEEVEPNVFHMTLKVGVAAIKGTYNGRISLEDLNEPSSYKLTVGGQGSNGFLNGEGIFELAQQGDPAKPETVVNYKGKANVGGTLAGIGARMLSPVAKKMAGDFFKSMDKHLQAQSETPTS